jgi:hypothetical protein
MVPYQAYINLMKASWILADVIAVHPQLSYIESSVRYDVMHLTEVRKKYIFPTPAIENTSNDAERPSMKNSEI